MDLSIEGVHRLTDLERLGIADEELAFIQRERHGVSGVALQLDHMRARRGGGINDGEYTIQRRGMVAGHIRDHIWSMLDINRGVCGLHAKFCFF